MGLELRTDLWPLVVTNLIDPVTDADFEQYFGEFETHVLGRRETFASLVDASGVSQAPTAHQRKMIADWQKRNEGPGVQFNVGVAMVIESRVVRGAMTALQWLFPPVTPTHASATVRDAMEFLVPKLEARGVNVPLATRGYRGRSVRKTGA